MRVALTTYAGLPGLDDDDRLVVPELEARDLAVDVVRWDDPAADWGAFDLVVNRSTWDYMDRRDEFVAWAATVPRLANSAEVLTWNTDKRYLRELASAGLPVVETAFAGPGEELELPAADEIVIKPTVSGGSRDTARHADPAAARAHAEALQARGLTVMAQPYLDAVDVAGETALLFFGGSFSHAIRKGPLLEAGGEARAEAELSEEIDPREPSPAERAVAATVIAELSRRFGAVLYARVDLLRGPGDQPLLLELETTEPSLFLRCDDGAPARFADAIASAVAAAA